jgi:hypothetical protein
MFVLDAQFRHVAENVACCKLVILLSGVNVGRVLCVSGIRNIWIVAFTEATYSAVYFLRVLFGSLNIIKYLSQTSDCKNGLKMANIAEICSHLFYIKLYSCCVRLFLPLVIKCLKITNISFDHVLALWLISNKGHLMNTESSSCLIELVRQIPEYCSASITCSGLVITMCAASA